MLNAITPIGQVICIVGLAYGATLSLINPERLIRRLAAILRAISVFGASLAESMEIARTVESRFDKGSAAAVREAQRMMFRAGN